MTSDQCFSYRFGFNGYEKDDEVKGSGNSYSTHFRQNDTRLGRWFSRDPKANASESPYVSLGNNPLIYTDVLGDTLLVTNDGILIYDDGKNDGNIFYMNENYNRDDHFLKKPKPSLIVKNSVQISTASGVVATETHLLKYLKAISINAGFNVNEVNVALDPVATNKYEGMSYGGRYEQAQGDKLILTKSPESLKIQYHKKGPSYISDYYGTLSLMTHERRHKAQWDNLFNGRNSITLKRTSPYSEKIRSAQREIDAINVQLKSAFHKKSSPSLKKGIKLYLESNQQKLKKYKKLENEYLKSLKN
jgi:RHS repeat-associated protein